MRILYDSKSTEFKKPFGCIRQDEKCFFNIKIPSSCETQKVFLRFKNEISLNEYETELFKTDEQDFYETFSGSFSTSDKGLYFYYFYIITSQSSFSLFKHEKSDTNIEEGNMWQLTVYDKDFKVGDDFKGKVMYQIFPDRFYRESVLEAKDKLTPYFIHTSTDDIPDYLPDENGEILNCDFFGGNLKGIEKKLPYIKSLGVSIIYLNPIFKAYSNHRYDTCDYKCIDPLLGTEEDFKNLCSSAHKMEIKIILDGVFSHTGSNSIYFDKKNIFGNGAFSNENSPYRSWYNFKSYPHSYDSWWGIDTLPCVNENDESFTDFIIEAKDSVISHWLSLGADGFRLDVADELPDEFIYKLRKRVKEIKENSYVLGEVWEDASNKISYSVRRKYFSFAQLDSVMNYVYKNILIAFAREEISAIEFASSVMEICENYPEDALHSLMNSLSTHDTPRILTELSDVDNRLTKSEKACFVLDEKMKYKALQRLYIASFLQYLLPGNTCIYYGDEIGMEGFNDPFNRGYFKWDNQNEDILSFFREMGKIKNSFNCFKKGNINIIANGKILETERFSDDEKIKAIINMGDEEFKIKNENILIAHNVSLRNESIYVQKYGFVLFKML